MLERRKCGKVDWRGVRECGRNFVWKRLRRGGWYTIGGGSDLTYCLTDV